MFDKRNFCHVASNNRNEQKAGIFVYKTTDDLQTVLQYGYFNEKIIDINLHDLIIHVKRDAADRTKVERNLLCVVERTLDDVGTILIKSNWEKTIEETIADIQTIINSLDDTYVRIDGTSIMTGPLLMRATESFKCAIAPYWDGVGFFKLNDNNSVTLMASIEYNSGFEPATTNTYNIGASTRKWKNLYLSGKAYMSVINNGYDIAVPVTNSADTLALKSEVDLAANSGRMITDQGVWYAKMYAATVAPSAENGTNYADFSQTDGQGNPVIVTYNRVNGAWVQDQTITPPAEYDGYVSITSKIWDITEQAGQQGGRILWNHQSKEFTPYPQIISFENAALTGTPTAPTPTNSSPNYQIANKEYVDNKTSQQGYHPDLFDWKWSDALRNDVQWLRADTFSWQSGSVYEAAYKHLRNDMYNWYSWANNGTTIYTKKAYPEVGEKVYSDSALTTEVGEITDVTDTLDITVEKITVNGVVYDSVSGSNIAPTTETVGGVTVQYILAEDGHKIVTDFHESEVADVYTATGVAWYYIIDIPNKRFKLPRTKWGVTGYRDGVGNYVDAGLPNITGSAIVCGQNDKAIKVKSYTGAFKAVGTGSVYNDYDSTSQTTTYGIALDASDASSVYGASTTVQPRATQMYLYFYVGNFTQSAIENTAGINTEDFNNKVDTDFGNTNMIDYVVAKQEPTAENNYTWYRKYKSGWVEQGGRNNGLNQVGTNTLPITMADTSYSVFISRQVVTTADDPASISIQARNLTTTSFQGRQTYAVASAGGLGSGRSYAYVWEVKGMAA